MSAGVEGLEEPAQVGQPLALWDRVEGRQGSLLHYLKEP
jgi:hypothetical protein